MNSYKLLKFSQTLQKGKTLIFELKAIKSGENDSFYVCFLELPLILKFWGRYEASFAFKRKIELYSMREIIGSYFNIKMNETFFVDKNKRFLVGLSQKGSINWKTRNFYAFTLGGWKPLNFKDSLWCVICLGF